MISLDALGFFLCNKFDTQRLLQSFITFAYTQFHTRAKVVQTDDGTKLFSMRQFFLDHDIKCQRTCVYTPNKMGWLSANIIISS